MELNDEELKEYEALNAKEPKNPDKKDSGTLKDNMSWIMISLLSVMQVVISCLSSVDGNVQFVFPTSAWGWILLIAPKIIISVLGYMIWNSFFNKGKEEGKKTEEYKKSQDILLEIQGKSSKNEIDVVNPKLWERQTKVKKGIKMVAMLTLTTFLVAELAVNFNISSLVSSVLSLLISVLYGFEMMITAEEMFSVGYLRYATLLKVQFSHRKQEEKENLQDNKENQKLEPISGSKE